MIFQQDVEDGPAERAGRAQVAIDPADDAGAGTPPPGAVEDEPVRDGKFRERPGPQEVAKVRYERKRRELVEKMDELKKAGLGDVHPAVRSVAQALEALEAEQGVKAGS